MVTFHKNSNNRFRVVYCDFLLLYNYIHIAHIFISVPKIKSEFLSVRRPPYSAHLGWAPSHLNCTIHTDQ